MAKHKLLIVFIILLTYLIWVLEIIIRFRILKENLKIKKDEVCLHSLSIPANAKR